MTDVCLLLEGTFPYVSGGVSTWVNDLILEFEDISFSILYLGPHRYMSRKMHYAMPKNVVDFRELYIFDYQAASRLRSSKISKETSKVVEDFMLKMTKRDPSDFAKLAAYFQRDHRDFIRFEELIYSPEIWKIMIKLYKEEAGGHSFIDFFWTWRFIYLPFFSLFYANLPPANLYHAVSTGYAGLLGALSKARSGRPLILTEHGIYTRERKIDIAQAEWIFSQDEKQVKVVEGDDFFRDWWMNLFSFLSVLTYSYSDEIVTLFEGNRRVQIEEGAPKERTSIIPNGVVFEDFGRGERVFPKEIFRIGFMGRVVPIKDVKTFIRACKIVYERLEKIEVLIMGATDEDEQYYKECQILVERENLSEIVKFCGKINPREYYPNLDVLVLTSISEGQPIVVLEAGASGIPVVATDVGACRELLYGATPDDELLGKSGILTSVCSPQATAEGIIRILTNPGLYLQMSESAKERVRLYYHKNSLMASYRRLYARYIEEVRWQE